MRFETLGGTPLLAMQRYDPISRREIRVTSSVSPSHSATGGALWMKREEVEEDDEMQLIIRIIR